MTRYRLGNEAAQLSACIERGSFTTAAGLQGNQKLNLELLPRTSSLYASFIERMSQWAVAQAVEVVTAVPNGATRYAVDIGRHTGIPVAMFKKQNGVFRPHSQINRGLALLKKGAKTGVVEDVCSTRASMLRFAQLIPGEVVARAIIDRGQEVPGVRTLEESQAYTAAHPYEPPVHIEAPFQYDALIKFPMPLMSLEAEQQ